MTNSDNISQGLIEAVGQRVRASGPQRSSDGLDAEIERLRAPVRRENEGMSGAAAFQWGAHPIASSKRAAMVRARLDQDYAAWRTRQAGEPDQA